MEDNHTPTIVKMVDLHTWVGMDKILCNVWQLLVQTQHVGSCIVISFCNQKTLVTTFVGINLLHLFCQIEKMEKIVL